METIGSKIKLLRRSKGLSLMDLVEKLGALEIEVSDTALSKIETGKTKSITIDLGKGIAKALDISFNELFDIEETSQNQDQIESLKEQIENLKEKARYNISLKKAVLMSFYTSFTHISNNINRYEAKEESELRHESLYDFTNDFKKNLIELNVFVDSDFESFEGK